MIDADELPLPETHIDEWPWPRSVEAVTISQAQMNAIQVVVDKANAAGMRLTVADVVSALNHPAAGKVTK